MELSNYSGLYGEQILDTPSLFIRSETIRDRSELFDWEISPHIHNNLFQLFFIESGKLHINTEESYTDQKGSVLISIPPGIVHGFSYEPPVTGHIITVESALIEEVFQTIGVPLRLFLGEIKYFNQNFTDLYHIALNFHQEVFQDNPDRLAMLRLLLGVLFVRLHRIIKSSSDGFNTINLQEQYFIRFLKLMADPSFRAEPVGHFATSLNISSVHLNRICHSVAGKSASTLLQENIVREAKKLLLFTSYTVAEIAYELNFSDPAYFSRLFKKHTRLSPVEFRKTAVSKGT